MDKLRKDETMDAMICELFFDRQEKAIEKCQEKYGKLAMKVSYNILHNKEDSEECVNDAMLGLWNSIPPQKPRSLPSYLCQLVRNISLNRYDYNHAKKRNGEFDLILDELEGIIASPEYENEFEEGEITACLNLFLFGLKEKDRVVFVRRYYYSDSVKDIADAMGESEGAVSMKLMRLRQKLKTALLKEGICL